MLRPVCFRFTYRGLGPRCCEERKKKTMAITYNYINPATGATPPTAAQAAKHQTIVATATGDSSLTSFTITHNWNLSTAQRTAGFPLVTFTFANHADAVSGIFLASETANAMTFTCLATLGTVQVALSRLFSMLQ